MDENNFHSFPFCFVLFSSLAHPTLFSPLSFAHTSTTHTFNILYTFKIVTVLNAYRYNSVYA